MTRAFLVVDENGPENWSGFAPDVPGCASTGANPDDLRRNLSEALEFHLEGLLLSGALLPEPVTHVVEVPEGGAAEWIEISVPLGEAVSA